MKKVKYTVPWKYVINDRNGEEIQKIIKRKGDKLYVKGCDNWFNSWIDKKDKV